ncbi:MAG: helix-hairpin-helix domain-containing protein, partial [Polyangia bacterium]|nr:helix-hairpin-helix domain-containing protein [Polyangia bacterium]
MTRRLSMAAALGALLTFVSPARAADYGLFIDIESEEDLLDLKTSGEITDQTFETLRELLEDGVDLNTADRETLYALPNLTYKEVDGIIEYRKEAGYIEDPAALVKAGALDAKKLGAIAPFIVFAKRKLSIYHTKGRLRYGTTYMAGDKDAPSMFLQARVQSLRHLDVGLSLVLTRDWLGAPVYDPNRDSLAAYPAKVGLAAPKFFAQWNTDKFQVIAGTYRIGFGQRLIFDNTGLYSPNGIRVDDTLYISQESTRTCKESQGELPESPCSGTRRYRYQSPDYRWTDRLRGFAFGVKKIGVAKNHWMQIYGFASYQTHSIYQYQLYDRGRCQDPRNDSDPACSAPNVYRILQDRLAPTSRYSFSSLPEMYNELVAGGNVTYFFSRRSYIGVTGYGATVK